MVSLQKYVDDCKAKLAATVPAKHKNRAEQYHAFLRREIAMTNAKLDSAKMGGQSAAPGGAPAEKK